MNACQTATSISPALGYPISATALCVASLPSTLCPQARDAPARLLRPRLWRCAGGAAGQRRHAAASVGAPAAGRIPVDRRGAAKGVGYGAGLHEV
eukprot:81532-Chlamydomonas_euryale.AAC.1